MATTENTIPQALDDTEAPPKKATLIDASDLISSVISILYGWSALAAADGLSALGANMYGGNTAYHSIRYVIQTLEQVGQIIHPEYQGGAL